MGLLGLVTGEVTKGGNFLPRLASLPPPPRARAHAHTHPPTHPPTHSHSLSFSLSLSTHTHARTREHAHAHTLIHTISCLVCGFWGFRNRRFWASVFSFFLRRNVCCDFAVCFTCVLQIARYGEKKSVMSFAKVTRPAAPPPPPPISLSPPPSLPRCLSVSVSLCISPSPPPPHPPFFLSLFLPPRFAYEKAFHRSVSQYVMYIAVSSRVSMFRSLSDSACLCPFFLLSVFPLSLSHTSSR